MTAMWTRNPARVALRLCVKECVTSLGHHVDQDGAVLGAVNASALRADRGPAVCAASGIDGASAQRGLWYLRDGLGAVEFDDEFRRAYPASVSLVSGHDTTFALPNAESAAAASQDPDRSAHPHKPTRGSDVRPTVQRQICCNLGTTTRVISTCVIDATRS
jgi:hypothetical protein